MAITKKRMNQLEAKIKAMGFYPFVRESWYGGEGENLYVSAEHGDDAADYWGEFHGGYPWINPKLEKLCKPGEFWEWENPGCIYLSE